MTADRRRDVNAPLRVAVTYAVAAALWVLFSDAAAAALFRDPRAFQLVSTVKGWAFVAVTATVLFGALRAYVGAIQAAEAEARDRERRVSRIVETVPAGILLLDPDGRFTFANERAQHILRLGSATIEARTFDDPGWRIEAVDGGPLPPEDLPLLRVVESGKPVSGVRFAIVHPDGGRTVLSVNASPMRDQAGSLTGVVLGIADETDRYEAEQEINNLSRLYSTLGQMNQAIVRIHDAERLYTEACRIAVEYGRFRMAWVGMLDAETGDILPVAHAGHEDGYLRTAGITVVDEARGRGPVGTAVRIGKLVISNDVEHDPFMVPWRDDALARGYRSLASLPLRPEDEVAGAFTIYASERGFFNAEEVRLLEELADDVSFGLRHIAEEKARRINEMELRTCREILDKVEVGVFTATGDPPVVTSANRAFAQQHAYAPEEVVGMSLDDMLPPGDRPDLPARLARAAEEGHVSYESVHQRKDGTTFPVLIDVTTVRHETGAVAYRIGTVIDLSGSEADG